MDWIKEQKKMCRKKKVAFWESPTYLKVGVSENIKLGIKPLNGLRIFPEGDTTGWYIWAGEELSQEDDFFLPLHISHLLEWCPEIIKFLGLPPGYRFLIASGYEDVWRDDDILASR